MSWQSCVGWSCGGILLRGGTVPISLCYWCRRFEDTFQALGWLVQFVHQSVDDRQ